MTVCVHCQGTQARGGREGGVTLNMRSVKWSPAEKTFPLCADILIPCACTVNSQAVVRDSQ